MEIEYIPTYACIFHIDFIILGNDRRGGGRSDDYEDRSYNGSSSAGYGGGRGGGSYRGNYRNDREGGDWSRFNQGGGGGGGNRWQEGGGRDGRRLLLFFYLEYNTIFLNIFKNQL